MNNVKAATQVVRGSSDQGLLDTEMREGIATSFSKIDLRQTEQTHSFFGSAKKYMRVADGSVRSGLRFIF